MANANTEAAERFAKNLRYYLALNNKHQQDLIDDLGLNSASTSYWYNGLRLPRPDKVKMLASYLNVDEGELMYGDVGDDIPQVPNQQEFSSNLRKYMALKNVNQQELASDLGLSPSIVSRWCQGTNIPKMDKINRLATYFDIEPGELLSGEHAQLEALPLDRSLINKVILLELLEDASADDIQKVIDTAKVILRR